MIRAFARSGVVWYVLFYWLIRSSKTQTIWNGLVEIHCSHSKAGQRADMCRQARARDFYLHTAKSGKMRLRFTSRIPINTFSTHPTLLSNFQSAP